MIIYEIITQALGIAGIIASVMSFQSNKHKVIMALRSANEFFFGIQYFLLGAYTGMMMNFIGVIRNTIFANLVRKRKSTLPFAVLFSIIFIVFICLTWAGGKVC